MLLLCVESHWGTADNTAEPLLGLVYNLSIWIFWSKILFWLAERLEWNWKFKLNNVVMHVAREAENSSSSSNRNR